MSLFALPGASPPEPCPKRRWDVKTARSKLEECDKEHTCRGAQELPTRLLDLGTDGDCTKIKLIITAEGEFTDRRYAAVSYCWGTSTPLTTQPSTLRERLEGFARAEMPATLREAAQVVHDLGIRYLWVDALCILQGGSDDVEAHADWKRESAGMAKVFGNAYLTIVAAGSSDCGGGLIPEPIWTMAERVTGESESVVSFGRQPLFTRAWAQQEWLLSSRLLVFTDTRMHFVCNVWEAPARHASHKLRLPDLRAGPYDKNWKTILIDFSARNLTRPSDKLPAISGLAKLYSDIADGTLGDYYAGLWQAHLVKDLVWRVDEPGRHYAMWFPLTNRLGRSIVNSRPRAPSWSWAAVDGPISFIGKGPIFATVIHCYTEPSPGCDQFGEVMFGLLVIRCPFFTASLKGENTDQLTLEGDTGESCLFWIDDPREVYQLLQH